MSSFEIAQVSPPVVYGAQLNQPSNNAHIAQIEYDEFLQYHANKQTSPQVVSIAQPDMSVTGNSFACVSQSSTVGT